MTIEELLKAAWFAGWQSCHDKYINGADDFINQNQSTIDQLKLNNYGWKIATQEDYDKLIEYAKTKEL